VCIRAVFLSGRTSKIYQCSQDLRSKQRGQNYQRFGESPVEAEAKARYGLEQSPSASDRCNSLQKALVTAHADLLQYISPVEPVLNLHNPDSTLPEELQLNKEQLPEFNLKINFFKCNLN